MVKLRIGILQYNAKIFEIESNCQKVYNLVQQTVGQKNVIDLLLLPEMCFTGYCFKNIDQVSPCAEYQTKGKSFEMFRRIAKDYDCFVVGGYPEVCKEYGKKNNGSCMDACDDGCQIDQHKVNNKNGSELIDVYYNSQYVIDRQGELVYNYRKTFLYETDKNWCTGEERRFASIEWPKGLVKDSEFDTKGKKIGLGICMDINPCEFEAPFEAYEFATFHKNEKSNLILFSANWLDSDNYAKTDEEVRKNYNDNGDIISYWLTRLVPLIGSKAYFCCSNRVGCEGGVRFTGGSCAVHLENIPVLYTLMDKLEEKIDIVQFEV